jgi:oligopeptide/dipeptide ABC transporter ATP-binding protein
MALLEVDDLRVSFATQDGIVSAVRGVSFTVAEGETLGIVGESGSGKSVATQTIVGLTRGAQVSGSARFEGRDLLAAAPAELRSVRGAKIAMIFQDPLSSLHPQHKVGWQIAEMIRVHKRVSREQARARVVDLLGLVGIPEPARRVDDYPHQFSGGMRQRAMIAMALALNPKLIIADEPTTALDVTVQAQILQLLKRVQAEFGTAVILITHDLGVIARVADRVTVMYAGKAMEYADKRTLYHEPHHPYTEGLTGSLPQQGTRETRLKPIPGQPPSLLRVPGGCPFHPRCGYCMPKCRTTEPPAQPVSGGVGHLSACWLPPGLIGTGESISAQRSEAAAREIALEAGAAESPARTDAATS